MNILGSVGLIAAGIELARGVSQYSAARAQARAYGDSASFALEFGEEQARFAEEIAALEASLLRQQGRSGQDVANFNADVARRNAAWEQRSGAIALEQARTAGRSRVSSIAAGLASQGRLVEGGTSAALMDEAIAQLDLDLANLQLTTQSRVAREQSQADFFVLQGQRTAEFAEAQSRGRIRAGEVEAEGIRQSSLMNAAAANTNASSARLAGTSSLLSTFSGIARGFSA